MNKLFLTLLALTFTLVSQAQVDAINKFFSDYEDNPDFTVVYVSPMMFEMVAKMAGEEVDEEIVDVVKDLKGLKILRTELNPLEVYKEAKQKINTSDYEVLLTARDKCQNIRFLTKTQGEIVNELLLLVGGEKEFVLLSFVGDLDLNKIAKLASKLDLDGAEHLEKLKNE
jgi:hypothetical protein